MIKDSSKRQKTSQPCNQVKLQSVLVKPGWQELAAQQEHIKHLIQLLNQQVNVKLSKSTAKGYVKDLRRCLNKETPEDGLLTERQIVLISLLNQNNLIVINAEKFVKQMVILLIQLFFSANNLSMSSLRKVVFNVIKLLPEEFKRQCQKEMLSESIKQLQMNDSLLEINPENSAKNLFAMMVLDDYIEADVLILEALEQIQHKNTHIAKAMLEVLCVEYAEDLRQKCNKPLNLKHLFYKLEEKDQPMENYSLNVFDELSQTILQTKWTLDLQNVLQENFELLDEQKLCLAVHHFPTLQGSEHKLVETVSLKFREIQNEINDPECLRQFLRGIALKKFYIDAKTQKAVFEQITKNISNFNADQCQIILHKLVFLNIRDHKFSYLIVDQLCKKIDQINMEILGRSIWSLGILGQSIDQNQKQCFEKKIYDLVDEFDERLITQIFYGLAGIFWQNNYLLIKLCQQVNKLLENNSNQNSRLKLAVGVLGNLIKCNFYDEKLYNIFSDIILSNVQEFQVLDFVYFISAFGFAEKSQILENQQIQNIFQKIVDQTEKFLKQLGWLQLIKIVKSIAYTRFKFNIDQNLVDQLLQKLIKKNFFTIVQAADLICCVAKLHEKKLLNGNQQQLVSFFYGFIKNSEKKLKKEKEQEVSQALKILGVNQCNPQELSLRQKGDVQPQEELF